MRIVLVLVTVLSVCALSSRTSAQVRRVVIAASTVLDGKGGVVRDTRIVIEGTTIVAIDPKAGPVDYDLRGLTVLPGWIDAHVHLTWIFGKDGQNLNGGETTMDAAYRTAANAWANLMAGFTTVQSVGSPGDLPLRPVEGHYSRAARPSS
jgi:imidazolonepropionase-like amidohydrolase